MKIYITRHGQVLDWGIGGNAQFPKGDPPLSAFGREQGTCLGKYLKHLGFSGKIYSSPFARALETAEMIAAQTGSRIIPWAPIREIVKTKESTAQLKGMTLEQIRERFEYIDPEASLPYPWWGLVPETPADVTARVKAGLDALAPAEDILLVGHGASVYYACEALQIPHAAGSNNYNCGFSMYNSEDPSDFAYLRGDHLPYTMRTFNRVLQKEEDEKLLAAFLEQGLQIPEDLLNASGKKLLQIGNTHSAHYSYIAKIIAAVKPDRIVHTGNFVEEVKAGHIPNVREEYTRSAQQIADILKNSGAEKIYAAIGKNDIPDVVAQALPFAELSLPDGFKMTDGWSVTLLPEKKVHTFAIPDTYHWNKI